MRRYTILSPNLSAEVDITAKESDTPEKKLKQTEERLKSSLGNE